MIKIVIFDTYQYINILLLCRRRPLNSATNLLSVPPKCLSVITFHLHHRRLRRQYNNYHYHHQPLAIVAILVVLFPAPYMVIIMHAEHHFPISKIIKKTLIIIITENIIRGISDIYCKFREEVGGIAVLLCKVNNLGELCNSDKSFNSGFALTLKE